jgi:hypothetical protein
VTLTSAVFDAFEGASACLGSLTLTDATITPPSRPSITVNPGSIPGFCHYTVTGNDGTSPRRPRADGSSSANPPAFRRRGNNQTGMRRNGSVEAAEPSRSILASPAEPPRPAGASVLFTTSQARSPMARPAEASVIATTNASGVASVTLTLPSSKGTVTVTAQDQFALGGASVTFTETAN